MTTSTVLFTSIAFVLGLSLVGCSFEDAPAAQAEETVETVVIRDEPAVPTNIGAPRPVSVFNGYEGHTSHVNAEHYVDFGTMAVLDELSLYIDQIAVELSVTSSNPELSARHINACVMADEV